jgi:hypothetical protein
MISAVKPDAAERFSSFCQGQRHAIKPPSDMREEDRPRLICRLREQGRRRRIRKNPRHLPSLAECPDSLNVPRSQNIPPDGETLFTAAGTVPPPTLAVKR